MPDRVRGASLARALAPTALLLVALAGCLVGPTIAVGVHEATADDVGGLYLAAAALGFLAGLRGLRDWSLLRGQGRYVFVDEGRLVWAPGEVTRTQWFLRLYHLTDATTEESIGWIDVSWLGWWRLRRSSVWGAFGSGSDGLRALVLTGDGPPVRTRGPLRSDPPMQGARWWRST